MEFVRNVIYNCLTCVYDIQVSIWYNYLYMYMTVKGKIKDEILIHEIAGGCRSPAVACWASDHWVASSNPLRGKFRH